MKQDEFDGKFEEPPEKFSEVTQSQQVSRIKEWVLLIFININCSY